MKIILSLLCLVALAGCVSLEDSNYQQAVNKVNQLPRDEQPAYLTKQYERGLLSKRYYDQMMTRWRVVKAQEEEEAAVVAQMTPKERLQYRMQKESIELQQRQIALAEDEARMANLRHVSASGQSLAQSSAAAVNNNANTQAVVGAINSR